MLILSKPKRQAKLRLSSMSIDSGRKRGQTDGANRTSPGLLDVELSCLNSVRKPYRLHSLSDYGDTPKAVPPGKDQLEWYHSVIAYFSKSPEKPLSRYAISSRVISLRASHMNPIPREPSSTSKMPMIFQTLTATHASHRHWNLAKLPYLDPDTKPIMHLSA